MKTIILICLIFTFSACEKDDTIPIPLSPTNLTKGKTMSFIYSSGVLVGAKTNLQWSASQNFTGYYYIYRRVNDNNYDYNIAIDSTLNTEIEVRIGLNNTYYFVVTAKNEFGESDPSNEISISTRY